MGESGYNRIDPNERAIEVKCGAPLARKIPSAGRQFSDVSYVACVENNMRKSSSHDVVVVVRVLHDSDDYDDDDADEGRSNEERQDELDE